ncbi:MAG TPA: RIP metalloprotease RseP [Desulfuromonadaceae bacterium]|jgi:regulator of sigma E protease
MMLIYAIIVLGILIFVHELGHFLVAKFFNVKVEKFSLGFGPKLFGKTFGETEYLVSAFPLGGYVKMFGEGGVIEGEEKKQVPESEKDLPEALPVELTEEEKARSFAHKPPQVRIAIVMAGPLFNLVFAWIVFVLLFMIGIPTITTKVGDVMAGKPAARAGIIKGDVITAINGRSVKEWDEISDTITKSKGAPVTVNLRRGATELQLSLTPESQDAKSIFGEAIKRPIIGVTSAGEVGTERHPPVQAFLKGSRYTWKMIDLTFMSLVKLAQRVVPLDNIGGPLMIVKMAGDTARAGGMSFLAFMALISINLGVLNLLPVPVLDGGHLFFYFWELIFRKPVSQKTREYAQQVGLFLLLSLMVLAFYNDIVRYYKDIMKFFISR